MPQVLLKGCEGTHGKSDCSGFFQCSLLLMQLEQCKKGSDKQEKSDYRFMPQLWQFQTQGREKEEQQIKIIEIFFFTAFFSKQDCFIWNWAWSLCHLKLKFSILKQTMSTENIFFHILFCFIELFQNCLQINQKQFSSRQTCLIYSLLGCQMDSSQHAYCKTNSQSAQKSWLCFYTAPWRKHK